MNENVLNYCPQCGEKTEKAGQKFCTKCGARLVPEKTTQTSDEYVPREDTSSYDGTGTETEENGFPRMIPKSTHGMKWYLFLVMFYMTFVALENTLNAFMYISGNYAAVYEMTPAEYYAKYGGVMKGADVAFGIILIGAALYMFLARRRMMNLRKNAPALFLAYQVVILIVREAYYVGSILIKGEELTLTDVSYVTALIAVYTAFIIFNAVYFKKRIKMFRN